MVSMHRALTASGAVVTVLTDGDTDLSTFDAAVLPGVGATGPAMATLRRNGLIEPIRNYRRPLLAVCVGMQILFEFSQEDRTNCLSMIPGVVKKLKASPLPHMGWNDVHHVADPLFGQTTGSAPFYFVHSFAVVDDEHPNRVATTQYQGTSFLSAVRHDKVVGLQFHPERSSDGGIGVIRSFVESASVIRRVA